MTVMKEKVRQANPNVLLGVKAGVTVAVIAGAIVSGDYVSETIVAVIAYWLREGEHQSLRG